MAAKKVVGTIVPKDATVSSRPDLFGVRGQLAPDGDGGLVTFVNQYDKPEYATPEASGVEVGFYVKDRGTPWHVSLARTIGTRELMDGKDGLLNADEAFEAFGGIDVELIPVQTSEGVEIPGRFAVVNKLTRQPLGDVGRTYKPFQERDLIKLATDIVDSGEASFETGAHLQGGRRFFLSLELNHLDIIVPGDDSALKTYLLIRSSHDGSKKAEFHITQVRTVCKNTEELAITRALSTFAIRHTGRLEGRVAEARRALGVAFRNADEVKAITGKLATTTLVDQQIRAIFEKAVWPVKTEDGDEVADKQSRIAVAAFENYLASPTIDSIRGTAWGGYNAVTEYLDHLAKYRGGKLQSAEDARADSLLYGDGLKSKERALKALLAASK